MYFTSLLIGKRIIAGYIFLLVVFCKSTTQEEFTTWKVYSGTKEMIRYSSLSQIDGHIIVAMQMLLITHKSSAIQL